MANLDFSGPRTSARIQNSLVFRAQGSPAKPKLEKTGEKKIQKHQAMRYNNELAIGPAFGRAAVFIRRRAGKARGRAREVNSWIFLSANALNPLI
jgi:hypothetical protein